MLKVDINGNVATIEVRAFVLPESEGRSGSVSGVFSEWFASRLRKAKEFRSRAEVSHRDFIMQECHGISSEEIARYQAGDMATAAVRECLEQARAIKGTNRARIIMMIDAPTHEAFEQEERPTVEQMEAMIARLIRLPLGPL